MPRDVSNIIIDYCHWTRHMISVFEQLSHVRGVGPYMDFSVRPQGHNHTCVLLSGAMRCCFPYEVSVWRILCDCDRLMIDKHDYNRILDSIRDATAEMQMRVKSSD